jgi:hydrogenase-4 membrane subunit HyfE
MITPFGAARLLGFGPWPACLVQGAAALVMAVLVGLLWRRDISLNLRCARLLSATVLAVPLALLFDTLLVLVAIGWLLREAREHGFLGWEKLVLLTVYPLSLVSWAIGVAYHVPLGPIAACAVLVLCLRRVWRDLPAAAGAMPPASGGSIGYAAPLGATP